MGGYHQDERDRIAEVGGAVILCGMAIVVALAVLIVSMAG